MHAILTRAQHFRFAGTNVPQDFVEAPSQMLENWTWDKSVLDSFAADYRDPSKKIPAEILGALKAVAPRDRRRLLPAPALLRPDGSGIAHEIHDDNARKCSRCRTRS